VEGMDIYFDTGTTVKVSFIDNQVLIGKVHHWTPPGDSEEGIQELTIIPTDGDLKGRLVNFTESEVKEIKIID
jgi:hypothetical protein